MSESEGALVTIKKLDWREIKCQLVISSHRHDKHHT